MLESEGSRVYIIWAKVTRPPHSHTSSAIRKVFRPHSIYYILVYGAFRIILLLSVVTCHSVRVTVAKTKRSTALLQGEVVDGISFFNF